MGVEEGEEEEVREERKELGEVNGLLVAVFSPPIFLDMIVGWFAMRYISSNVVSERTLSDSRNS